MEDVHGRTGKTLTLDDYRNAAYDLGTTQHAYDVIPDHDWLSRRWLHGWVLACARYVDVAYDDERLAPMRPLQPRVDAMWQRRDDLVAIVDAAPQTLVHCDLWPTNVIAADDGTTIVWRVPD